MKNRVHFRDTYFDTCSTSSWSMIRGSGNDTSKEKCVTCRLCSLFSQLKREKQLWLFVKPPHHPLHSLTSTEKLLHDTFLDTQTPIGISNGLRISRGVVLGHAKPCINIHLMSRRHVPP